MSQRKLVWLNETSRVPLKELSRKKIDQKLYEASGIELDNKYNEEIYLTSELMRFDGSSNENDRIYNREAYLEAVNIRIPWVESNRLFGEPDHPEGERYSVSMKEVSHMITRLWYDESQDKVFIEIKLIPTLRGKDLIAIHNSGGVLSISGRAIGFYDEDTKEAYVDTLFTADVVDTPGQEDAILSRTTTDNNMSENKKLKRVSVSYNLNESVWRKVPSHVQEEMARKQKSLEKFSKIVEVSKTIGNTFETYLNNLPLPIKEVTVSIYESSFEVNAQIINEDDAVEKISKLNQRNIIDSIGTLPDGFVVDHVYNELDNHYTDLAKSKSYNISFCVNHTMDIVRDLAVIHGLNEGLKLGTMSKRKLKLNENYIAQDGKSNSEDGYNDAGMWPEEEANSIAKKLGGTIENDPSGKFLVIVEGEDLNETATSKSKDKKNLNEMKIGHPVKIPSDLTTDPVNKQGKSGTIKNIDKESGNITVEFEDGIIGNYMPDALEYDVSENDVTSHFNIIDKEAALKVWKSNKPVFGIADDKKSEGQIESESDFDDYNIFGTEKENLDEEAAANFMVTYSDHDTIPNGEYEVKMNAEVMEIWSENEKIHEFSQEDFKNSGYTETTDPEDMTEKSRKREKPMITENNPIVKALDKAIAKVMEYAKKGMLNESMKALESISNTVMSKTSDKTKSHVNKAIGRAKELATSLVKLHENDMKSEDNIMDKATTVEKERVEKAINRAGDMMKTYVGKSGKAPVDTEKLLESMDFMKESDDMSESGDYDPDDVYKTTKGEIVVTSNNKSQVEYHPVDNPDDKQTMKYEDFLSILDESSMRLFESKYGDNMSEATKVLKDTPDGDVEVNYTIDDDGSHRITSAGIVGDVHMDADELEDIGILEEYQELLVDTLESENNADDVDNDADDIPNDTDDTDNGADADFKRDKEGDPDNGADDLPFGESKKISESITTAIMPTQIENVEDFTAKAEEIEKAVDELISENFNEHKSNFGKRKGDDVIVYGERAQILSEGKLNSTVKWKSDGKINLVENKDIKSLKETNIKLNEATEPRKKRLINLRESFIKNPTVLKIENYKNSLKKLVETSLKKLGKSETQIKKSIKSLNISESKGVLKGLKGISLNESQTNFIKENSVSYIVGNSLNIKKLMESINSIEDRFKKNISEKDKEIKNLKETLLRYDDKLVKLAESISKNKKPNRTTEEKINLQESKELKRFSDDNPYLSLLNEKQIMIIKNSGKSKDIKSLFEGNNPSSLIDLFESIELIDNDLSTLLLIAQN